MNILVFEVADHDYDDATVALCDRHFTSIFTIDSVGGGGSIRSIGVTVGPTLVDPCPAGAPDLARRRRAKAEHRRGTGLQVWGPPTADSYGPPPPESMVKIDVNWRSCDATVTYVLVKEY